MFRPLKHCLSAITVLALLGCQSQPVTPTVTSLSVADKASLRKSILAGLVTIPAGEFAMGDIQGVGVSDELPVHQVRIDSFQMGRKEVTFADYDLFAKSAGRSLPADQGWGRGQRPVVNVSWEDAQAYIQWLSAQTGLSLRLPTESEWEYAARAGTNSRYSFGDDANQICQYGNIADQSASAKWRNTSCNDGYAVTAPVGSFKANAYGLHDMHGNVWEWLEDCWVRHYKNAPGDGSAHLDSGCKSRVQRGGSWFYGDEEARSSYRSFGRMRDNSVTVGFRLARDVE
jgi:formylglycine-generating enzyme required for sulfatase activity